MGVVSDGTTVIDNGAVEGVISWQSSIKTSSFTAVGGEGYWINTTSGAVTVTLPASASVGDTIVIVDYLRTLVRHYHPISCFYSFSLFISSKQRGV